jgi:hypothetical protein
MNASNDEIFVMLFQEACQKCFGHTLTQPLSETDSKVLSNTIFEQTGLVIGVKTIKNYSSYILNSKSTSRKENPSVATLDTLARYVLNAPYIDELKRKKEESHHPYWFQYRSGFRVEPDQKPRVSLNFALIVVVILVVLVSGYFLLRLRSASPDAEMFVDHFDSSNEDSLKANNWIVQRKDTAWWKKRAMKSGHVTLFTLNGDNWPSQTEAPGIRDLLIRKIPFDCFTTEVHLNDFFPSANWQQAGILLSEDSSFVSGAIRISISYNDFFGGYTKPAEIIIQGVSASENVHLSKPEEFAHVPLFTFDPGSDSLIRNNLKHAALKIEKRGNHYRFLYTGGSVESFAFREIASGDFGVQPTYLAIFAIQGLAEKEQVIPVHIDSFSISRLDCD